MEDELRRQLETLIKDIDDAHQKMTDGAPPTLGHLEKNIDQICTQITNAPTTIAKNLQPIMADLINRLDHLEEEIEIFKNNLET